jgi:hypothetical protein
MIQGSAGGSIDTDIEYRLRIYRRVFSVLFYLFHDSGLVTGRCDKVDSKILEKIICDEIRRRNTPTKRAQKLYLLEEELAFYDAIAENYHFIYDNERHPEVVHEVVGTIKKNLKVDWTKPHRMQAKAAIRPSVKKVLRRKDLKKEDFDEFLNRFMDQAEAMRVNWPSAA